MRLRFIGALLLLAAGATAQPYVVPQPDLRIAIPLAPMSAAVERFDALEFDGEAQPNGIHNCNVHVQLQQPRFQADSWNRYADGAGGFRGGISSTVDVFTTDASPDCNKIGVPVTLAATACTDPVESRIDVEALVSVYSVAFSFTTQIPNPFVIPLTLAQHLAPIPANNGFEMKLEFGDFVDGQWVVSERPLDRTIRVHSVLRGLGGIQDPTINSMCEGNKNEATSMRRGSRYLVADMSFAREATVDAPTVAAADAILDSYGCDPAAVAVTAVPRLLGDGNPGVGIIGALLPMRLSGAYEYKNGKKLNFAIALVSGRAEFRAVDGKDSVLIGFRMTPIRVWTSDAAGDTALSPNNLVATMVTELPALLQDGSVHIKVREFGLGFHTTIGSDDVCVSATGVEQALNKDPVVVSVVPDLVIALPDCVDTGSNMFNAARPCADGSSRRMLSNSRPSAASTIRIDVLHPQTSVKDGRLSIAIPIH